MPAPTRAFAAVQWLTTRALKRLALHAMSPIHTPDSSSPAPALQLSAFITAAALLGLNGVAQAQCVQAPIVVDEEAPIIIEPEVGFERAVLNGNRMRLLADSVSALDTVRGDGDTIVNNEGDFLEDFTAEVTLSPTDAECLSDNFSAPLLASGMNQLRTHMQDSLNRLIRHRQTAQGNGTRMYLLGGNQFSTEDGKGLRMRAHRTDLVLGADHRFNTRWTAGASMAHGKPLMKWSDGSRADGSATTLTAYGSWSPTDTRYVAAAVSMDHTRYAVSGGSTIGSAQTTHAKALATGISVTAGQDFQVGSLGWSPYVRLDSIHARMGDMGSSRGRQTGHTSAVALGAQASHSVPMTWGVLVPHARLEWQRVLQWKMGGSSAHVHALSQASLGGIDPTRPDRDQGQAAMGLSGVLHNGVSLFADYEQVFEARDIDSWKFTLGVRAEL